MIPAAVVDAEFTRAVVDAPLAVAKVREDTAPVDCTSTPSHSSMSAAIVPSTSAAGRSLPG